MPTATQSDHADRQRWMAVLARASAAAIRECLRHAPDLPAHTRLRGPEAGLVMVRGRAGGGGAPFNLGEMTVTRCTVRAGDQIGHAYVAGRRAEQAELAARLDAALQDAGLHDALQQAVIQPLAAAEAARRAGIAGRAAATQVKFFTMATMRG
jgi:alpha-D-ribose 1-methylphosphonate 5-triphosphate synthase subunit PhnG